MKIYLDQCDLSRLGNLATNNPLRSEVISFFNDTHSTLILSYGHVTESAGLDFQTIGRRNSFLNEIHNKMIVKQFVEIVHNEIEQKGKDQNPFYLNFHENAGIVLDLSDPFGFWNAYLRAKKYQGKNSRDQHEYMCLRDQTSTLQKNTHFSREQIYCRLLGHSVSERFRRLLPKHMTESEINNVTKLISSRKIILPTYETFLLLRTEMILDYKRRPKPSDQEDLVSHLVVALVYCDIISTDKYFRDIVGRSVKHKKKVVWGKCFSFDTAESLLNTLRKETGFT
ncbi:MAG: hypothetical protein ABIB65_04155 [Candidatus Margulisiibacteriota bacterium]